MYRCRFILTLASMHSMFIAYAMLLSYITFTLSQCYICILLMLHCLHLLNALLLICLITFNKKREIKITIIQLLECLRLKMHWIKLSDTNMGTLFYLQFWIFINSLNLFALLVSRYNHVGSKCIATTFHCILIEYNFILNYFNLNIKHILLLVFRYKYELSLSID